MYTVILDAASLGNDISLDSLQRAAPGLMSFDFTAPGQIIPRLQDASIAIVNKTVIDAEVMAACPTLKMIAVTATGTNNIDLEAARQRGIRVCNVIRYGRASLVQHTFMLILTLAGNLDRYRQDVKAGHWHRASNFCLMDHPIMELEGKTLGVVGYGDLGQGVAEMGRAFGMQVMIAQRPGQPAQTDRIPLDDLLPQADVLSLHCLLSNETRNLIDARELALMKPTALLINTARGGLVNEDALAHALTAGRIGGAGFDVLTQEPPVNGNVLLDLQLPNLIVTPHCAWASREARQRLIDLTADNIARFMDGTLDRWVA